MEHCALHSFQMPREMSDGRKKATWFRLIAIFVHVASQEIIEQQGFLSDKAHFAPCLGLPGLLGYQATAQSEGSSAFWEEQ